MRARTDRFGRTELPEQQQRALQRALRIEWATIGFLAVAITAVGLVMGGSQAANVLLTVRREGLQAHEQDLTPEEQDAFMQPILDKYEAEGSPYYSSARLWDDGILDPLHTRDVLALGVSAACNAPIAPARYGIFRM